MKITIENDNSVWDFWELFKKTVRQLRDIKQYSENSHDTFTIEKALIRFIERLPSGDYSNIREQWMKKGEL